MGLAIIQVDAFTDQPFAGNPAAVCVMDKPIEEPLMQAITSDMPRKTITIPLEDSLESTVPNSLEINDCL